MSIEELSGYRDDILENSKDEDGFIQQSNVLNEIIPEMHSSKLLDSEDFTLSYYISESEKMKLNAFARNDTGERLQLFIVDEETVSEGVDFDSLMVSNKSDYESQIKRVTKLVKKIMSKSLNDSTQDSHPVKPLISYLASDDGLGKIDVVEVFLLSLTATVSFKGEKPQLRDDLFLNNETVKAKLSCGSTKEVLIKRQVIDLNFIANVFASKGGRQPLTVRFKDLFPEKIELLFAASEESYKSYLCVLKGDILEGLYREYGARLLEKNVRSFLQFKGVNKGIKATIKSEPEKFVAYNNGLTITAKTIKTYVYKRKTYLDSLEDFQIVNGGQTTASIYFSKKEGISIDNVNVMVKVNVVEDADEDKLESIISNISKYSNTQSRVSSVDLRSRNPKLVQLKRLSESVVTPSGKLWFFERAKGEFNTMVRRKGTNGKLVKKKFPTERRFSKELLAKYFCAWGDSPFEVKKGGEKIFRKFIEHLDPEDEDSIIEINRDFYENMIAKVILFRTMEKVYGAGKNSLGQLRSAVIPYSLSVLYQSTDSKNKNFNFSKIWKEEVIDDESKAFLKKLMILVNKLIKKYSNSDDYGEYSKKEELWIEIKKCQEVKDFLKKDDSKSFLNKYHLKDN